MSNEPTAKSK